MSFRLLPKDVRFFDLFVADGENLQAAAAALRDMVDAFDDLDRRRGRDPARSRSAATRSTARYHQRLEDAFVTPFDREDIHELTVRSTTSSMASRRPPRRS